MLIFRTNRNYHLPVAMERKKVLLDRETDKMKVKAVISKFWYRSNGKKGVWPIKHAVNIQPINLRDFNHRQKEALMETRKKIVYDKDREKNKRQTMR